MILQSLYSDKLALVRWGKYLGLWVRNDLSWDDHILERVKMYYCFRMCRCLKHISQLLYEVRDLFPWKMTTKMIISCLLNKKKSETRHKETYAQLESFNENIFIEATISTEKSTNEIDTDLAQNEM